ncbi:putative HTH-type transcriptional regulator YisR [Vallitalea longa]|uniref:HTH-type transcriptional regulator YisR n=1 Tax=Vallitalea longa TaxID=2936439 RepID=A0A9W5Y7L9_9FIRM|nr:AraC family transcriptional regulator [Vallitalea longa]GKX28405.1 putative HTH-type transcriptional regulator YisR [Vallitalea longa]
MHFQINLDIMPKVRYIGYINYVEPWIHFSRESDEFILYIIENGTMYLEEDYKEYILKKGDFFLLEPNKFHKGYKKASCSYYYVHFKHPELTLTDKKYIERMMLKRKLALESDPFTEDISTESISFFGKHFNISNKLLLINLFYTFKDAINDYCKKLEDYKIYTSCKLHEIFIKICREYLTIIMNNQKKPLPRVYHTVQNIIDYINDEYQKKLTSTDIEEIFELNYDYLNRAFQKITGYSILNYLNIIRINKAKELISSTSLKVSEIGYLVGVEDPYYFSRLFKKYVGVPPSKYRI